MVLPRLIWIHVVALALGLGGAFPAAVAQQADPLAITLTLKRVDLGPDGKEALADASSIKPGDLVEYRAVYANKSSNILSRVMATLPLPEGFEYQPQASAGPAPTLGSVDGKTFLPFPLTRTVTRNGRQVSLPIPYAEYRGLRWQIGQIPAGGQVEVSARARVSQATAAATR